MYKKLFILMILFSLIFLIAGCSKTKSDDVSQTDIVEKGEEAEENTPINEELKKLTPSQLERYDEEGAVQIGVIFANPLGLEKEGYLTFVVQMDNHSYNLDEYDLSQYAALVDDQGNSPKGEIKWEIYSGGGHHVINYLMFTDGGFITQETEFIKLIIKDFIDVPERNFIWEKEVLGIKE